ncbi:MAG TPA: hypothetical protein VIL57_01760 [Bacteroidia bacterium]
MTTKLLLHIPFAFELPIKINITGDPQKDAQYLLIGIAACILLLILTIITLIILAFRRKKKKKKAADLANQSVTTATSENIAKVEPKKQEIAPEPIDTTPEPKPVVEAKEPVKEIKVEEAPKAEPKPEPKPEKEKNPEDKMDEIRKRLAEIAQNRKNNPNEYQEVVLPKLTADFAKTVSKEDAANSADSFEEHETEEIPNETESAANSTPDFEYEEQIQNLNTDFKGEPISDSDFEKANEEIIKTQIENEVDSIFAKQELDTDFSGEPISDSNFTVENTEEQIKEDIQQMDTDFSGEPIADSNFHSESEKLNAQFQNTQLPVKRMTFTEWMDSFK